MADQVLQEKMESIAKGIITVQEKVTALEKKYDGVDLAVIAKAGADAAKGLEELQALRQKIKADELMERLFSMEQAIVGQGAGKAKETAPQHKQAFYNYLRRGSTIPAETIKAYCDDVARKTLINADETKVAAYAKDLFEGSNPDGGYFITPERSAQIIRRVFETSPMRTIANIVTTSSNSWEMIIDDQEPDAGWVGEVDSRTDTTTPKIGLKTIPVHEVYSQPRATTHALDDVGFDLEGWLQGKVTGKFSRLENTSFVVGNGSKKPRGFLTYAAWASAGVYERDALEQITSTGTSAKLDESDDLISLQGALIEDYQMDAVFVMSRGTFVDCMKLKDTDGQYLLNPRMMFEGADRILLGKPVVIMSDMPTVAANALSVAYGNFGEGYTIVDRFGIRVLRDPYTAKPYVRFYSTKRVGGDVTNFESIKILKIKP